MIAFHKNGPISRLLFFETNELAIFHQVKWRQVSNVNYLLSLSECQSFLSIQPLSNWSQRTMPQKKSMKSYRCQEFFPGKYTCAYISSWNLRMTCVSWNSCQDRHPDSGRCTYSITVTYFILMEDIKVKMRIQTPQCPHAPACMPRAQLCHKSYITVFKVHRNAFTMINNSLCAVLRSCNDSLQKWCH